MHSVAIYLYRKCNHLKQKMYSKQSEDLVKKGYYLKKKQSDHTTELAKQVNTSFTKQDIWDLYGKRTRRTAGTYEYLGSPWS